MALYRSIIFKKPGRKWAIFLMPYGWFYPRTFKTRKDAEKVSNIAQSLLDVLKKKAKEQKLPAT